MPHDFHLSQTASVRSTTTGKHIPERGVCDAAQPSYDATPAAADFSHIFSHAFLHTQTSLPATQLPPKYSQWEDALARAQDLPLSVQDQSAGAEAWRQNLRNVRYFRSSSHSDLLSNVCLDVNSSLSPDGTRLGRTSHFGGTFVSTRSRTPRPHLPPALLCPFSSITNIVFLRQAATRRNSCIPRHTSSSDFSCPRCSAGVDIRRHGDIQFFDALLPARRRRVVFPVRREASMGRGHVHTNDFYRHA